MLFKKNKPEQPQSPKSNIQGPPAGMAGDEPSFFAPGLNPHSAPIDFGFDQVPPPPEPHSYIIPAPPSDSFSLPEPQSSQMDWNAGLSQDAQSFFTEAVPPVQENWGAPVAGTSPVAEPLWEQPAAQGPDNSAYLGSTFENYVAQEPEVAQNFGIDTATAWQPSSPVADSGFDLSSEYQPSEPTFSFEDAAALSSSLDPMVHMPELLSPFEQTSTTSELMYGNEPSWGGETPASLAEFSPAIGEVMPWEQPQSHEPPSELQASVETLRHNLGAGNAQPGEQVSVSPGALLDSMHQQFYPEDPFGMEQGDVLEGQQAFEDAAQFLFPDTVSASLDWQSEGTESVPDYGFVSDFQMPADDSFAPTPLDLGPSVQQPSSDISELSGFEAVNTWSTPNGGLTPDDFSLMPPESLPLSSEVGLSEGGVEIGPFSPDAFSIESNGFTESAMPEWSLPESVVAPESGVVPSDSYIVEQNLANFSLEISSLNAGYEAAFSEESVASELSPSEWGTAEWDLNEAESWQASVDAYSSLTENQATALPEIAIETVPLDPFGDMEAVHWDPATAQQAELEELWAGQHAQQPEMHQPGLGLSSEYNPQDTWINGQTDMVSMESTAFGTPLAPEVPKWPNNESDPFAPMAQSEVSFIPPVSDQDFYATEFTLDEFGELVPVRENDSAGPTASVTEPMLPPSLDAFDMGLPMQESHLAPTLTEPEFSVDAMPSFAGIQEPALVEEMPQGGFFEPSAEPMMTYADSQPENHLENQRVEQTFWPHAESVPVPEVSPAQATSPFAQAVVPPIPPLKSSVQIDASLNPPEALQQPAPSAPSLEPELALGTLEAQWQASAPVESAGATQAGTVTPPAGFTLGNLEVLGICPLAADRRLLVVHSNGIFALMGQVGQENPNIFVLKVFESNPLAYQNTFTAVAEAQAAAQGMFVTQVGTWHAIVSTFQDKITLHTELG